MLTYAKILCECGNTDRDRFFPVDLNGNRLEKPDEYGCAECMDCNNIIVAEKSIGYLVEKTYRTPYNANRSRYGQRVRLLPMSRNDSNAKNGLKKVLFWDGVMRYATDSELTDD